MRLVHEIEKMFKSNAEPLSNPGVKFIPSFHIIKLTK